MKRTGKITKAQVEAVLHEASPPEPDQEHYTLADTGQRWTADPLAIPESERYTNRDPGGTIYYTNFRTADTVAVPRLGVRSVYTVTTQVSFASAADAERYRASCAKIAAEVAVKPRRYGIGDGGPLTEVVGYTASDVDCRWEVIPATEEPEAEFIAEAEVIEPEYRRVWR